MGSVLATLLALSAAVIPPRFQSVGGHDGVQVYRDGQSPLIDLMAAGEIEGSPEEVQAALLDYGEATRLTKHLAESRVLTRRPGELWVYQYLKLPVIKDRDYTMHVRWRPGDAGAIRFSIDGTVGPRATSKAVRMTIMRGSWELEPIRGGRATRAVYHVELDFAGSVPRWMVSGGAAKDLPNLFQGLRQLVAARRAAGVPPISLR